MVSIVPHSARLTAGDLAPDFAVTDSFGQPIQLQAVAASQRVLLSFLRNGACAMCNLRVSELIRQFPAFKSRGVAVLTVFESPIDSIRQSVGRQDAPFPIIPDPDAQLYTLYGVETSAEKVNATMSDERTPARIQAAAAAGFILTEEAGSNFHRIPADFLIERGGRIHTAFYADIVGEHLSFDRIETWMRDETGD